MNNEISVLTTLQHPGIVKFVDAFYSKSRMYIILDLVSGINLSQKVICGETSEKEIKSIVYQLLKIVKYMHSIGVIHRDIKLENIMMTEDSKIFLIHYNFKILTPWKPNRTELIHNNFGFQGVKILK